MCAEARAQGDALAEIFEALLHGRPASDLSERETRAANIAAEVLTLLTAHCPHEKRVKELEERVRRMGGLFGA